MITETVHLTKLQQERYKNLEQFFKMIVQYASKNLLANWIKLLNVGNVFSVNLPFPYTILLDESTMEQFIDNGEINHSYHWMFLFATRATSYLPINDDHEQAKKFYTRLHAYYASKGEIANEWAIQVKHHTLPAYDNNGQLDEVHSCLADEMASEYIFKLEEQHDKEE